MDKIKNLIFDVGEVLLQYRWKEMLMDYGLTEEDAIRVGSFLFNDPDELWHIYDLGTMSQAEIIEAYCKKHPADNEAIRWFISHGEFMHVARPEVWKMVHTLKEKGYGIYVLSNYPEELFEKHTKDAGFMEDLDGLMVSYMINKAKPDAAIYEALCSKYHLKKEECLFFDDRIENVEGAKAYGMESIQVLSQEGLLEELEKFV